MKRARQIKFRHTFPGHAQRRLDRAFGNSCDLSQPVDLVVRLHGSNLAQQRRGRRDADIRQTRRQYLHVPACKPGLVDPDTTISKLGFLQSCHKGRNGIPVRRQSAKPEMFIAHCVANRIRAEFRMELAKTPNLGGAHVLVGYEIKRACTGNDFWLIPVGGGPHHIGLGTTANPLG